MRRRWRKKHLHEPAEVNITAFMNLMVILVPFLLITAVFTRVSVLDLSLPGQASAEQSSDKPKLQLEVLVYPHRLSVGDRVRDQLESIVVTQDGSDLKQLSTVLQQVKNKNPDHKDITLLMDNSIAYDRMVAVMDRLRTVQVVKDGSTTTAELFPSIAIGDAPAERVRTARSQ